MTINMSRKHLLALSAFVAVSTVAFASTCERASRNKLPERILSGMTGWFLGQSQDGVRYLVDRCSEAGFNSIDIKIQDAKPPRYDLESNLAETRSLMEYANSKGLIFQLYLYPVPYKGRRCPEWKEHAKLPCIVDAEGDRVENTFLLTDSAVWKQLFFHAFKFLKHHDELPFATLKFDIETIPAAISYDDANWRLFCRSNSEFSAAMPAAKRRSALDKKRRYDDYARFFHKRTEAAIREFVAALREVDRDVILGYMPAFKGQFHGDMMSRVLASKDVPAIIDYWDMYNGEGFDDRLLEHARQAVAANPRNLPVPWIRPNCYSPESIAPAVYQAAAHTAGYSLWSLGMFSPKNDGKNGYRLPVGTTAESYWKEFKKANVALRADMAAGIPESGKRIPREKTKALAVPLVWNDVAVPDLVPAGDGIGPDHEFVVNNRHVFFIFAKAGENIEVSIRHVAGRQRPVALHYALLDDNLGLLREESVTPCSTDTFKVAAPKTGTFALVATGGEGGLAWFGVTVRNGLHYALDARNGCRLMRDQYVYMPGRNCGNDKISLTAGSVQAVLVTIGDAEPILMVKEKTKLELDLAEEITRFKFAKHPTISYFDSLAVKFPGGNTPLVFGEPGRRLEFRRK